MIKHFKHKGLESFFETGNKSGFQPDHALRLARQLRQLNDAASPREMNMPGWRLHPLSGDLAGVLASARQGALLREGMHVVLVGQPNVGKSSLMNALAGDDIAIVTDIAGTTRDTVREQILIDGIPLHLIDTAGLRDTDDVVEQHGIARTWAAVERADLALVLLDDRAGLTEADAEILARLPARLPRLVVRNKIDLSGQTAGEGEHDGERVLRLSARSGDGVDALRRALLAQIGWQGAGDGVFLARERHLDALRRARAFLDAAELDYAHSELFADHLRMAQLALSDITGNNRGQTTVSEVVGVLDAKMVGMNVMLVGRISV